MARSKVAVLLPRLSGHGGTETVVNEWIKRTNQDFWGFDVDFVAASSTDTQDWHVDSLAYLDHHVHRNRLIRLTEGTLFTLRYLKSTRPNIVVVLSTKLLQVVSAIRKIFRLNFQIVTWLHFSLRYGTGFDLSKISLADWHLCISSGIKDELLDLGIKKSTIFVIGNPVKPVSSSIMLSVHPVVFVYVGRLMLHGQKNLHEMFLGLKGLRSDWQLKLIGDGPEEEITSIKTELSDLKIADKVEFFGWRSDPWSACQSATAVLLTSKYEGFGMTLAEACARGIPCVSSDCPVGPRDIISPGKNGFLYCPGSVKDLTKCLSVLSKHSVSFNQSIITDSVSKFYPNQYFSNLRNIFRRFLS